MMSDQTSQLLLSLGLNRDADFDSFYCLPDFKIAINTLKSFIAHNEDDNVYLLGAEASGKSHLLQAICHEAEVHDKTAMYLPIKELLELDPFAIFEGHQQYQFLCIDDIDAIEGDSHWQEAVFHLFNERLQLNLPMFFTANQAAVHLPIELADLKSRLSSCLSFQLKKLSDEQKMELLQFKAQKQGMLINDACAQYIIMHYSRNVAEIATALSILDTESLARGRKITIPLIKEVLLN